MTKERAEEILDSLEIGDRGEFSKGKYTIVLSDSDAYAAFYTTFDNSDEVEEAESTSVSTEFLNIITYEGELGSDPYKITLNADFNRDYYSVVVEDLEPDDEDYEEEDEDEDEEEEEED